MKIYSDDNIFTYWLHGDKWKTNKEKSQETFVCVNRFLVKKQLHIKSFTFNVQHYKTHVSKVI